MIEHHPTDKRQTPQVTVVYTEVLFHDVIYSLCFVIVSAVL